MPWPSTEAVWLFDVIDDPDLDARVRELGEPAAVVQLLDRHNRDCGAVAQRLGRAASRGASAAARDAVRAAGRWSGFVSGVRWRSGGRSGGSSFVADAIGTVSVLLHRRGAGRRPSRCSRLVAAALAARLRARSPAGGARGGRPPSSGGAGERADDGAAADPALAGGPAGQRARRRVERLDVEPERACGAAPGTAPGRLGVRSAGWPACAADAEPAWRLVWHGPQTPLRFHIKPLAGAGEQARPDEPRRRLQPRVPDRRVERLGERRGCEGRGAAGSAGASA